MKHLLMGVAAAAVITMLAACSDTNSENLNRGRQIYNSGGTSAVPCATCHTLDGSELVGPSFQGLKDRAGSAVDGMSAEDYIRQSIVDPSAHIVPDYPDSMYKGYGDVLSDEDIDGLIAYLMSQ